MLDTVIYYTGACVLAMVGLALAVILLTVVYKALIASVSTSAQLIKAFRRGLMPKDWYSPPSKVWRQQFYAGTFAECVDEVRKAFGPVTPWVKK